MAGFTLPELLVTVAIAAILLGLAIPSYRTFMLDTRRSSVTNDVVAAMQAARSEAITRGVVVTVCPSTNGTFCATNISTTNWRSGWIVFVDDNLNNVGETTDGNGTRQSDEPAPLRVFPAQSEQISITAPQAFRFRPYGQSSSNATVTICDERGVNYARGVVVASSGRARIACRRDSSSGLCSNASDAVPDPVTLSCS